MEMEDIGIFSFHAQLCLITEDFYGEEEEDPCKRVVPTLYL